eukprot:4480767-Pyramimonas_sp.AAC.1
MCDPAGGMVRAMPRLAHLGGTWAAPGGACSRKAQTAAEGELSAMTSGKADAETSLAIQVRLENRLRTA